MPGVNYYDGSNFQEVASIEDDQGNQREAYRWDGSQWIKIWPAIPDSVVDNFEDADSDPAGVYESGETIADYYDVLGGTWSRTQSNVLEGGHAVNGNGDVGDRIIARPDDGNKDLNRYFNSGEVASSLVRTAGTDGRTWVLFGFENTGDGYGVRTDIQSGNIDIYRFDGGSPSQLASSNVSLSSDTWYDFEIDWATNGEINAEIFDIDAELNRTSSLATVSTTDTTYDGSGVGYRIGEAGFDATIADFYRIIE